MHQRYNIIAAYRFARDIVVHAGYRAEIEWQASLNFERITETDFLREHAWVTLSAGMNEFIVRRHFGSISRCFYDWQSADIIVRLQHECRRFALRHFNNRRKIDGIIEAARIVGSYGFESYKELIRRNPLATLQYLPFVGPVTCYHLAKNIGLPYAKPDRHLLRLAHSVGYSDVQEFCSDINEYVGDTIPVVDIVLWRFANITSSYLTLFYRMASEGQNSHSSVLENPSIEHPAKQ